MLFIQILLILAVIAFGEETYTYGDFYSHDTVRSSRLTVENEKLVIIELAQ